MAAWRDLGDTRWGQPIVRTLAAWCVVAATVAYLAAVAVAIALTDSGATDPVVQGPAAAASAAAAAFVAVVGVRRQVAPLFEAVEWASALARARWAMLGFPDAMPATGEGLSALEDRTDELAMAGRAAALAALGRADELEELLDRWDPETPNAAAAIARHRVNLAALRGSSPDPAPALAAAAILDGQARSNATALVHVDMAVRDARAGRSPVAALRAVRRAVDDGPSDVPVPRAQHLAVMTLWLTIIGCGIPVAVAVLLASGVTGLAIWVAVVAVVVVGSRLRYRAVAQR